MDGTGTFAGIAPNSFLSFQYFASILQIPGDLQSTLRNPNDMVIAAVLGLSASAE